MKKIFLLPALLLLILGAQAADKSKNKKNAPVLEKALQTNNSLFWQISGNGLEQPSYLYGTIHAIPQDDYFLGKKVSEKIKKAGPIMKLVVNGTVRKRDYFEVFLNKALDILPGI